MRIVSPARKFFGDAEAATGNRKVKRVVACTGPLPDVHVRAARKQTQADIEVTGGAGLEQCAAAIGETNRVDRAASVEQGGDHVFVAVASSLDERGLASNGSKVDAGAVAQQRLHDGAMAMSSGEEQCSLTLPVHSVQKSLLYRGV